MNARAILQPVLDRYVAAYRAGDAEGCAACFTEDAQVFSPYAPAARGRAEIAALHAKWLEDGENKTLEMREGAIEDALGWGLAEFAEDEDEVTDNGTSLCVFRRQTDGDWLIHMCSLNAAEPES